MKEGHANLHVYTYNTNSKIYREGEHSDEWTSKINGEKMKLGTNRSVRLYTCENKRKNMLFLGTRLEFCNLRCDNR